MADLWRRGRGVCGLLAFALVAFAGFTLALGSAGARVAANEWAGSWWFPISPAIIVLTQSGSSVSGTYTPYDGRISGTVSGSVLTGTWNEQCPACTGPLHAGSFRVTMDSDLQSFTGTYTYADGSKGGTWLGYRIDGPDATPPTKTMLYAMPDRSGLKGSDGLVRYYTARAEIDPKAWPVDFTLPGCEQSKLGTYTWLVDGKPPAAAKIIAGKQCVVQVDVGTLGKHQVTAQAPDDGQSYTAAVDARDFLILGLGDSVASGEGNPDITNQAGGPRWQDARCDRSAGSFEARAALKIERHDKQTSVTFLHLACSGAAIKTGVAGPYWGITPGDANLPLMSQAGGIKQLIGGRPIDAVMISIGANDVGFGPVLEFCVKWGDCPNRIYRNGKTLKQVIKERLAGLPALYDELAGQLAPLVPSSRVYLNLYPDELRDASGNFCDDMIDYHNIRAIRADEAKWMYDDFMTPLNATIAAAATAHGWNVITGGPEAFRNHGYCADPGGWVVTYDESFATQGDQNGTMHPNGVGHQIMGDLAARLLSRDLYPGGKPRPPGATGGGSGTGGGGQPGGNPNQTAQQAAEAIGALLKKNASACGYTSGNVRTTGTPGNIQAVATISGTLSGSATWSLIAGVAKPTNALATRISSGCRHLGPIRKGLPRARRPDSRALPRPQSRQ